MYKYLSQVDSFKNIKKFTVEELGAFCGEIRQEIIDVVSQTGGHLGSNLGVVELTVALHYVFDADKDLFVWDVSNQTYTHKILTGRKNKLRTLRQFKGLSGFGYKPESHYDPFSWGHAGTAISTALGVVAGDEVAGRNRKVIAITGDGAITEGISYEAFNNCGHLKKDLLVILNDNAMSISPTVGALSNYLNKLRTVPLYDEFKTEVFNVLNNIPVVGAPLENALERVRDMVKASTGMNIFNALGFQYYGPMDGHNLKLLIDTLQNIRHQKKPILLHTITKKGFGHPDAEKDLQRLHGISPKPKTTILPTVSLPTSVETKVEPVVKKVETPKVSYTKSFVKSLIKLAKNDKRILAITAAMPEGTGLMEFEKVLPNQYYDVSICEQHAVAFAAGLAHAGARPVAAIYSTFLQRAYDQIFQEVCLQNLPVLFCMDRGGLAGADGPTHHGVFDIAYLRTLPNIVLMAPRDGDELYKMLEFSFTLNCPSAIRYPRGNVPDFSDYGFKNKPIELGKAEVLFEGNDGVIFAYGYMIEIVLKAREILKREGLDVAVVNARFAKPIDKELLGQWLSRTPFIATLEDHSAMGGFGSAVLETASSIGADTRKIKIFGIPDMFIEHGERSELLQSIGLDEKGVAKSILGIVRSTGRKIKKEQVAVS